MDEHPAILRLLEFCLVENSDEAWRELLERLSEDISRFYARNSGGNPALFPEFRTWLPGWLY